MLKGTPAVFVGIALIVAGAWILWDFVNTLVSWTIAKDWELFCNTWRYDAPFYLGHWDCNTWTGPFDVGFGLIALGLIVLVRYEWLKRGW